MGDTGEDWRAFEAHFKGLRDKYGVECAECRKARPKGNPKILMPGQKCGYGHRDPRPRLSKEQMGERAQR